MLKKNGLTLYAVVPPPFIAPEYAQIVDATHGRSYNIVTEEGRFAELVREIGHSIATEYSLTYRTPRPIEDGTERKVELKVNYNGESATARHLLPGARRRRRGDQCARGQRRRRQRMLGGTGLSQFSFQWWNRAVPLLAILGLFGLSRMRFGVSTEELKAIVEAQNQPAPPPPPRRPPPRAPRNRAAAPRRRVPRRPRRRVRRPRHGRTRGARLRPSIPIDPCPPNTACSRTRFRSAAARTTMW